MKWYFRKITPAAEYRIVWNMETTETRNTLEFQDTSSNHKKYNFIFLQFLFYIFSSLVGGGIDLISCVNSDFAHLPTCPDCVRITESWDSPSRSFVITCLPQHLLRHPSSWQLLNHKSQGVYSCVWPPLPSFKGPFSVGLSREPKEIWLFSHNHSGPQETGKIFEVYLPRHII